MEVAKCWFCFLNLGLVFLFCPNLPGTELSEIYLDRKLSAEQLEQVINDTLWNVYCDEQGDPKDYYTMFDVILRRVSEQLGYQNYINPRPQTYSIKLQ